MGTSSRWRLVQTASAILVALAFWAQQYGDADAVIERIYTLPFYASISSECHLGACYGGHQGIDYQLGDPSTPGEVIAAAYSGTARLYDQFPPNCTVPFCAGYYVIIDHPNDHKTRYLHLNDRAVGTGQTVARGQTIGHEGNSGAVAYHLHFETRHNATAGDCCSGTAVDPSAASTFLWTLDPPVYSASTCYYPQDSASGPGRWPGVFRPSQNDIVWWHLRYSNTQGTANASYNYGATCDMPIVGDWDGDGDDTIGIVRPVGAWLEWHLSNDNGTPYEVFEYGNATDLPVAGDWNGDGTDSIGVFRPSNATWYLSNNNTDEYTHFPYGNPTDRPVVGDWDGDGDVTIGIVRPVSAWLEWHLRNYNWQGDVNLQFGYGNNTDVPLTGDWDWDGDDTIGVFRPSEAKWYLRNFNWTGNPNITPFMYGAISDKPITGDWY